jgi:hypothetical protein
MANNTIQIKRTSVSGRTPNTTNSANTQYIAVGELALNLADSKLYTSNGTGLIDLTAGGGGGSVNTAAQYTFTNTITFSNTITIANVSANGSTGTSGQVLSSDGTKAYWQTITPVRQSYTGDGTTTSFTVSGGYTANQLDVYLNGVKATSSEATVSSGTDVVFAAAPPNNAIIAVVGINAVTLTISSSVQKSGDTMTGSLSVGNVAISLNDIQISGNVVANSSGAVVSATYVQNTDSRFLSGNLNFTAANVNFTQGLFVGTTTFANTTGMYTTNINATSINATSFTTTGTLANTSGVYPTSNTSGFNLGNTISRWVITANSITTSGNVTSSASVVDVSGDVRSIPQNSKSATYELASSDNGKHISTTAGVTVNGAVLSTSQVFSIYNNSASSITVTQGTGATMYLAGSATTGNRTLAQRGICTVLMVGSNTFVISGSGLT